MKYTNKDASPVLWTYGSTSESSVLDVRRKKSKLENFHRQTSVSVDSTDDHLILAELAFVIPLCEEEHKVWLGGQCESWTPDTDDRDWGVSGLLQSDGLSSLERKTKKDEIKKRSTNSTVARVSPHLHRKKNKGIFTIRVVLHSQIKSRHLRRNSL